MRAGKGLAKVVISGLARGSRCGFTANPLTSHATTTTLNPMNSSSFATTLRAAFVIALCALQPIALARGVVPIVADFLQQLEQSMLPNYSELREAAQVSSSGRESRLNDFHRQSQIVLKSQNSAPLQRYVFENIRVSVFENGILAGDLNTGKVIWRDGFDMYGRNNFISRSVDFIDGYVVYQSAGFRQVEGRFVDIKTGIGLVEADSILLSDNEFIYLRSSSLSQYSEDNVFPDLLINRFDRMSKKFTKRFFRVYDKIDVRCALMNTQMNILSFVKKYRTHGILISLIKNVILK